MAEQVSRGVVVVTGASSGIGRETALRLAKRGGSLVLAARREDPLHSLCAECESVGAECLAVPTDVSNPDEVDALAAAAVRRFGRIDGWVNDAGVYLMGTLDETPLSAHRRVMDVNYFGVVHGTTAAVRQMKKQVDGGVVINIASQLGSVSAAYISAYTASKHAVRGFTSAVRQELLDTPIRLSTVMPASIDTPLFEHSANYTGYGIKPAEPVFPPEKVARTIVHLLDHPRAEAYVGGLSTRSFGALRHAAPDVFDPIMHKQIDRGHFEDERSRRTAGNLYEPMDRGTEVHGGYKGVQKQWARRAALYGTLAAGATVLGRFARHSREGSRRRTYAPARVRRWSAEGPRPHGHETPAAHPRHIRRPVPETGEPVVNPV